MLPPSARRNSPQWISITPITKTACGRPSGTTTYVYDALNRIDTITHPAGPVFDFDHDVLNRRDTLTLPNNVVVDYDYDLASQLTSIEHLLGQQVLSAFRYTQHDNVGNRKVLETVRSNVPVASPLNYEYDDLYRLTDATHPLQGGTAEHFEYDPLGNRLRREGQLADSDFDEANRLKDDGVFTYTYDINGNLETKTNQITDEVTTYHYDAENQLIAIELPGDQLVEYKYDEGTGPGRFLK